jgi:sugar phosphate isomerase/epimerase
MATAKRAIDISADLGVGLLRVAEPAVEAETREQTRNQMQVVGESLGAIAEYAETHGVALMIENHGISSDAMNWALEAANHPAVGTNFDPHNYLRHGEDPLTAVRNLDSNRIFYCHLKDAIEAENHHSDDVVEGYQYPAPVAVGDGDIAWVPILEELAPDFDGYVAIEPDLAEDVVPSVRRSIDYLTTLSAEHDLDVVLE